MAASGSAPSTAITRHERGRRLTSPAMSGTGAKPLPPPTDDHAIDARRPDNSGVNNAGNPPPPTTTIAVASYSMRTLARTGLFLSDKPIEAHFAIVRPLVRRPQHEHRGDAGHPATFRKCTLSSQLQRAYTSIHRRKWRPRVVDQTRYHSKRHHRLRRLATTPCHSPEPQHTHLCIRSARSTQPYPQAPRTSGGPPSATASAPTTHTGYPAPPSSTQTPTPIPGSQ